MKTGLKITASQKLLSWLRRIQYRYLQKPVIKPGGFFDLFFRTRAAQALQAYYAYGPRSLAAVIGNSRNHELEPFWNALKRFICLACSGSKIQDWLARAVAVLGTLKPLVIVDDSGGNNFLAGETLDDVLDLRDRLNRLLSTLSPNVLVMEIAPLGVRGVQTFPSVNEKIRQYNMALSQMKGVTVVKIADALSVDGVLSPSFDCGDGIHFSAAAAPIIIAQTMSALASIGLGSL